MLDLFQRNQVPAQSHGVGVEVRADGYGCVVPAIGQRKEYLGGNADTLDAEVTIHVAPFVGSHLDVRYGSVYCYTANAVRTWVYGVEGYLHGATSLVDQYEVGVGVYKCGLSVAEHHLVCLHYELVSFQGRHCVIVRNGILCLFFSFQACTFCVSLGFTVCALFSSTLLCIHGRCCHAYQYYCC